MNLFDQIVLLLTGLTAVYLIWRFYGRYSQEKGLYDLYYIPGFAVLFVSGVLLIFLGYKILGLGGSALSPYILPIASLIPLCISIGIVEGRRADHAIDRYGFSVESYAGCLQPLPCGGDIRNPEDRHRVAWLWLGLFAQSYGHTFSLRCQFAPACFVSMVEKLEAKFFIVPLCAEVPIAHGHGDSDGVFQ